MTVSELRNQLEEMPDNAEVILCHELVGDNNHYLARVEFVEKYSTGHGYFHKGAVLMHETFYQGGKG